MLRRIAMAVVTLLGANALTACVVAPVEPRPVVVRPAPVVVQPAYVAPTYVSPGVGWVWMYHPHHGWGWHHPDRGWHQHWRD